MAGYWPGSFLRIIDRDDVEVNDIQPSLTNTMVNSRVARDVTKNQTKKLSILLSFYFHEVLQYLNPFT